MTANFTRLAMVATVAVGIGSIALAAVAQEPRPAPTPVPRMTPLPGLNIPTPPPVPEISPTPAPAGVDFSNPASVLELVFTAARTENYALLADLCDPYGTNDRDTRAICRLASNPSEAEPFASAFSTGEIMGETTYTSEAQADIPFLFGPNGSMSETMNFVLRNGRWYLFAY